MSPEGAVHPFAHFPLPMATLKVSGKGDPEILQNVLNPEGFYPSGKEGVTSERLLVAGVRTTEKYLTSRSVKESEIHAILKGKANWGQLLYFLLLPQMSLA